MSFWQGLVLTLLVFHSPYAAENEGCPPVRVAVSIDAPSAPFNN